MFHKNQEGCQIALSLCSRFMWEYYVSKSIKADNRFQELIINFIVNIIRNLDRRNDRHMITKESSAF